MLRYIHYVSLFALTWASPTHKASIAGPVIYSDFPDPTFVKDNGTYYAFGTAGSNGVPMATSRDFITWTVNSQSALLGAGKWSSGAGLWAPDVKKIAGQYVMYYAALPTNGNKHCIGAAISSTPAGPYSPVAGPIVCDEARGGAIDPFGFTDVDGSIWLIYKVDGNSIGHGGSCNNGIPPYRSTPLMAQRMSANGLKTDGSAPVQILDRSDSDGPLVEAPAILRVPNGCSATYFLFFSSACYDSSDYDTSYAVSFNGVLGPYTKANSTTAPILKTGYPDGRLYGPGGLSVGLEGDNGVVFHSDKGVTAAVRQMWVGKLDINAGAGTVTLASAGISTT